MVMLIDIETNEYPIDLPTFYSRFINITFPREFNNYELYGYSVVFEKDKPELNILQSAVEDSPMFDKDSQTWNQTWKIVNKYSDHVDEDGVVHRKTEYEQLAITNAKIDLKNKISYDRYIKETSGYFDEELKIIFDTSRSTISILQQLKNEAVLNSDLIIKYKANSSTWVDLTSADIIRIYNLIFKFIQDCFSDEYEKHMGVDQNVSLF